MQSSQNVLYAHVPYWSTSRSQSGADAENWTMSLRFENREVEWIMLKKWKPHNKREDKKEKKRNFLDKVEFVLHEVFSKMMFILMFGWCSMFYIRLEWKKWNKKKQTMTSDGGGELSKIVWMKWKILRPGSVCFHCVRAHIQIFSGKNNFCNEICLCKFTVTFSILVHWHTHTHP